MSGAKIRPILFVFTTRSGAPIRHFMTSIPPSVPPEKNKMSECRHPRVQIVSRDEDAEFVECLECREIFESSEFKDMNIEQTELKDEL